MRLEGKTVAVLTSDETDTAEFEPLVTGLRDEGAEVVIVGPDMVSLERICLAGDCPVRSAMDVASARRVAFDALVVPDGPGVDAFLHDNEAIDFVAAFETANKPLAVLGRGVLMLVAADRLENRHVAAPAELRQDVEAVGGILVVAPFFKDGDDGHWITADGRAMLDRVTESLVCALQDVTVTRRQASPETSE